MKSYYDMYRTKYHPRPWELEVQSHIRNFRPPASEGHDLQLGFVGSDLAVVCDFGFDQSGDEFAIDFIGTDVRFQRQSLATYAATRALLVIEATKREYGLSTEIFTRIHRNNEPSQKLFEKLGFEPLGISEEDYDTWIYVG